MEDAQPQLPRVSVYGSACPACTQAKEVLDRFQINYRECPMSAFPRRFGVVRTMPQITIDDQHLGGINQLLKLARSGGLERIATDDRAPWVRITRRLGRGYNVAVFDPLGREVVSHRAQTQDDAARIAESLKLTADVTTSQRREGAT